MNNLLPSKDLLRETYDQHRPIFKEILSGVENRLKDTLKLASMPTFKTRVKKFDSYYRKLIRVKPKIVENQLPVLTDMIGIRVICAFLEDIGNVERQIVENFDVVEIERKGAEQTFKEFGYESVHVLIKLPQDLITEKIKKYIPEDLVCEIQIRTILQNAWAEVEHELVYKSEFSPFDLPLRRKLASMNASLTLADIIFQEIRDYQNKLNNELDCRRMSFYEKADELSNELLLPKEEGKTLNHNYENIASSSPYVHGTIDDMILEAIQSHNAGNMERAVEIYTRIIESKPEPNSIVLSVIYKHRGMAHFAMNNFEDALNDFIKSTENDPRNFRSFYYVGIVYSVKGENEKALEAFSQSLEINEYQSHVYYRKALAYYALSDYSSAMNALNKADKLGLHDDDCKRLHESLVKKLDMGMN